MAILDDLVAQTAKAVNEEISLGDEMFANNNLEHYLNVGRSALRSVLLAMWGAGKNEFHQILDLPCGHGRVLRILKAAFPDAELTACDILRDGVDFCARMFGARPIYASAVADPALFDRTFDLIWCGSLLTHLDAPRWPEFLDLFQGLLCPGGVLVFTTHGRRVAEWMRVGRSNHGLDEPSLAAVLSDYERQGFGYSNYQAEAGYGISLTSPAWTCNQLVRIPGLRLRMYNEAAWDNHHDVIACTKESL